MFTIENLSMIEIKCVFYILLRLKIIFNIHVLISIKKFFWTHSKNKWKLKICFYPKTKIKIPMNSKLKNELNFFLTCSHFFKISLKVIHLEFIFDNCTIFVTLCKFSVLQLHQRFVFHFFFFCFMSLDRCLELSRFFRDFEKFLLFFEFIIHLRILRNLSKIINFRQILIYSIFYGFV